MPIPFEITREDLLRGKVVTPGWYVTQVTSVNQGEAKTDGSTIYTIELRIMGGEFDGVLLTRVYSEKARGFAVPFIEAVTGKKLADSGGRFDLEAAVGSRIWTYVKNETVNSRLVNRPEDFRPYKEGAQSPF